MKKSLMLGLALLCAVPATYAMQKTAQQLQSSIKSQGLEALVNIPNINQKFSQGVSNHQDNVDLWAFSVVAYEIITGRTNFTDTCGLNRTGQFFFEIADHKNNFAKLESVCGKITRGNSLLSNELNFIGSVNRNLDKDVLKLQNDFGKVFSTDVSNKGMLVILLEKFKDIEIMQEHILEIDKKIDELMAQSDNDNIHNEEINALKQEINSMSRKHAEVKAEIDEYFSQFGQGQLAAVDENIKSKSVNNYQLSLAIKDKENELIRLQNEQKKNNDNNVFKQIAALADKKAELIELSKNLGNLIDEAWRMVRDINSWLNLSIGKKAILGLSTITSGNLLLGDFEDHLRNSITQEPIILPKAQPQDGDEKKDVNYEIVEEEEEGEDLVDQEAQPQDNNSSDAQQNQQNAEGSLSDNVNSDDENLDNGANYPEEEDKGEADNSANSNHENQQSNHSEEEQN